MIRTQGGKNSVQQRPSNALAVEVRMNQELKFNAAVAHRDSAPKVGSDGEADDVLLLSSNDTSLVTARLLSHMDSNNEGVPLIFSLL